MDINWDEILVWIEEKRLIPILGQDLLVVEGEGGPTLFYQLLARKLAEDLKIPAERLPEDFGFGDIMAAHLPFQRGREKIHSRLKLTYDRQAAVPVPETLRKLAQIGPIKLFVTTTFDRLLERALNDCRFDGAGRTLSIAYSPRDNHNDLSTEMLESNRTIVFQLFGQITSDANYVVTECDMVEFIHSLHAKGPPRLLQALGENNLLLLGNSFPPWVWRLFLRTAKNQVLWLRRQKNEVVVERQIDGDAGLREFIENFSDETTICDDMEPAQFVDELSARWIQHAGTLNLATEQHVTEAHGDPLEMEPGSIFISYSSMDRPAVEALCDALEEAKIDAWFDRKQLQAGDDWERKIRQNIRNCSLFLPVISDSVVRRAAGRENFRDEWGWAIERLGKYTGLDLPFLVPVVIDDTRIERAEGIPEQFAAKQATVLPDGRPTSDFIDRLRQMIREIRRRQAVTS